MTKKSRQFPLREHPSIIQILLKDRTTKKNILWGTDNYINLGYDMKPSSEIDYRWITNGGNKFVQPRVKKDLETQRERTKEKAEVFTPTWIVEKQNNLIEEEIKNLSLQEYINTTWLEITCGEAPYMCTRYDTVTGEPLKISDRVGFVDRKLQRINNEINDENTWNDMVTQAYQASYGYEYQGDSLLIARENLVYTYIDFYLDKFNKIPSLKNIEKIANIISFNVFQMNGLTYTVPYTEEFIINKPDLQLSLFDDFDKQEEQISLELEKPSSGKKVIIKNWNTNKTFKIINIKLEGENNMKFDVVIGNPPYQEMDNVAGKGSAKPLYNLFIEESIGLNPGIISLITPSVWFTGGKGLDHFRKNMLSNEHFKKFIVYHTPRDVFPNVSLRGGVNFFIWDSEFNNKNKIFVENIVNNNIVDKGKRIFKLHDLNIFISSNKATQILEKLFNKNAISTNIENDIGLSKYISARNPFGFSTTFERNKIYSKEKDSLSNPVKIYQSRGESGYVEKSEIEKNIDYIDTIKVVTPFANNIGTDLNDDNLNTLIIEPGAIVTETYLIVGMGLISTVEEANNISKYLKTKFVRFLISLAKANQNGTRQTYRFVPVQNFKSNSNINWESTTQTIDDQLFALYDLTDDQILYIQNSIKEME